jgi:curved DNA-binding protein CbpA
MNLYEVLGVQKDATLKEIKKAYKNKSKENHPDIGGSEELQADINKAYNILSNKEKRKLYDDYGIDEDIKEKENFKLLLGGVIEEIIKENPNNIKMYIDNLIEANVNKLKNTNITLHANREQFVDMKKRIKKTPDNDLFSAILEDKINKTEKAIKHNDLGIITFTEIGEYLGKYIFDERGQMSVRIPSRFFGSNASTTGFDL